MRLCAGWLSVVLFLGWLSGCAAPGLRFSPYEQGLDAERGGHLVEASVDFEKAVNADPSDPVPCAALADVFAQRGWLVRAEQQWRLALSQSGEAKIAEGERAGREGAWAAAARQAHQKAAAALLKIYLDRGAASASQSLWKEAEEAYGDAVSLDPGNAGAWVGLARASARSGDQSAAFAAYGRCFDLFPGDAGIAGAYGYAAEALGRHVEALAAYHRLVGLEPADASALNNEATVLVELGRFDDSLPLFDKALGLSPGLVQALDGEGSACYYLKRYREARDLWARALELAPEDVTATRDMRTLVTMGY